MEGRDDRSRDPNGQIHGKRSDASVAGLCGTYGPDFARACASTRISGVCRAELRGLAHAEQIFARRPIDLILVLSADKRAGVRIRDAWKERILHL